MITPMWNSIVAAGAFVLSVGITGVATAPHAAVAPTAPSDPAALRPGDGGHAVALASRANWAGLGTAPRDDGSDDGDDGDEGGDDDGGGEG